MDRETIKLINDLLGKRPVQAGVVGVDFPEDYNYSCPKCGNKHLQWSEFNGCVWCNNCQKEYPTCLSCQDPDQATQIFLRIVEDAIAYKLSQTQAYELVRLGEYPQLKKLDDYYSALLHGHKPIGKPVRLNRMYYQVFTLSKESESEIQTEEEKTQEN